ncbi:MAG: RNA polymerase sigma factor, partial [Hyphomicrobiales bacterium]
MRNEWGRVLAALIAFLRDFELAEDALQDACVSAIEKWPEAGLPEVPQAWLLQTAKRKAIDHIRRAKRFDAKRADLKQHLKNEHLDGDAELDQPIPDERLSLIFTCCHPALNEKAQVALTLKTLGGLTTAEIARAFMVEEKTMAQRIVRAKRKIRRANIPYKIPDKDDWPNRLDAVLATIYFIFNEGYAATSGDDLVRADLCQEAIRLARLLVQLAPHEPEAAGLLALLLLHDSRRDARTDSAGTFIPMQAQDRSLWNSEQIAEGCARTMAALARKNPGPYQIQAAISAVHSEAPSHSETDWREIVLLYGKLYELT